MQGVDKFNESAKEGIKFLQENDFLPNPTDPVSLATLLRYTPRINKTLLGQYFSKKANEDVLRAFLVNFDFKGVRLTWS
jgi:brefeldin A-resistance guanine nucleotide exchange factor 1